MIEINEMKFEKTDRATWIETIDYLEPTLAVTFNFNRVLLRKDAEAILHEFEARIKRKLFGKNAKKNREIEWIHFYELEKGNSHFHSVPIMSSNFDRKLKIHAKHIWAKLVNTQSHKGQLWIGDYQHIKWSSYITKKGLLVDPAA